MSRRVHSINLDEIGGKIIERTSQRIIDKNQSQLEYTGTDANGRRLRRYASNSYAARKHAINGLPGFGVPDLKLTGAFYKGWKVKVSGNKFEINSTDPKTPDLIRNYGEDIFGLQPIKKMQYSSETMQPELVKEVKKILKI